MTPSQHQNSVRRAFSLVELLVVVAIIAILVAIVLVGLRRMQVTAGRTESVNALRQMITGYLSYSGDNKNRLMPGYIDYRADTPAELLSMNVKLASGRWLAQYQGAKPVYLNDLRNLNSYVWRLSPYLDHNWRTMMTDYRDSASIAYFNNQYAQEIYGPADVAVHAGQQPPPTIATAPSFGLNSIFFGGDDRHGGTAPLDHNPWNGTKPEKRVATRESEVLNTSAVVFAPAAAVAPGDAVYVSDTGINGYPELRPPFVDRESADGMWISRQWHLEELGAVGKGPVMDRPAGLPIIRNGREMIPVARFNGSAEAIPIGELATDMRNWSPRQTGTTIPAADWN